MKLRCFFIYIALIALFLLSGLSGAALSAEWKSMFPPLTPNQIHDSYTPDGKVVYLAGNGGTIIKYDGTEFTLMDTPTMMPLYGIHGTGPANIWAVGGDNAADSPEEKGVVLHYDGSKWTKISAPVPSGATTGYSLSDVYVVSATDVWVVMKGRYSVFRWNGSAWESFNPFAVIPLSGGFNKVSGASASAIWFVGDYKNMAFWNGSEFRDITDDTSGTYNITSCWAADENTLFTGGNLGAITRWDSEGNYQNIDYEWRDIKTVSGISGTSANDVYFIGISGFFVHYNGTSGTWITPENDIFIRNTMTRVSNGDWIVGTERGIQKFSNNTLTEISTPSYLKCRRIYTAFWNNGLWIVPSWLNEFAPIEVYKTTGRRLVIYPPEGKSWEVIGANSVGDDDLRVYVRDENDYYLYKYSGRKWTEWTPPGYYSGMHDVLRTEGGAIFAVLGPEGITSGYACLVNDVSTVCAPGGREYNALAACNETVYAVGNGGAIAVYRDGAWTSEESGTDNNLTAVACSESEVYAAGEGRTAVWKTLNGLWQPVSGLTEKGELPSEKRNFVFTDITYDSNNGFTASYKAPETGGSRWISFIYSFNAGTATMEYGWLGPNISLEAVATDGTNVYAAGSGYNNPCIIIYSGTPLEYDPNLPDEGLFYLDDAIILLQVIAGLNPDADLTQYFEIINNEKIGLSEAIHILKYISQ